MAIAAILVFPQHCAKSAQNALRLWGLSVVPSLFPYMVLSKVLAEQLKKKKIPATLCAASLGLLGGSPSGAAAVSAYGDVLPRKKILALSALTGTISPAFLNGMVGAWLRSTKAALLLTASHFAGAIFAYACVQSLFRFGAISTEGTAPRSKEMHKPGDPLSDSIQAVLAVGGYIVVFSVLADLAALLPCLPPAACAFIHALLEAAGGMHAVSRLPLTLFQKCIFIAALSGFSGISILYQNSVFLRPLGVSMKNLCLFALLRTAGAGMAMALFFYLSMS